MGSQIVPIEGLAGAARVNATRLDARAPLRHIAISPRQDYVLASSYAGEVLSIVPGVSSTQVAGAAASPDWIVMSPQGTAAALWFNSTSHFQIVTGLPSAPTIRDIDAIFLAAAPFSIAISDDAQWLAASFPTGVYAWAQDASVRQLNADPNVEALAFSTKGHDLWLATPGRIFTVPNIDSNSIASNIYTGDLSPAGLALTFDNSKLVFADADGEIHAFDLAAGTSAAFDCTCNPEGVFPLGGSVFRLTSPAFRSMELFDAAASAVFSVPKIDSLARHPSIAHPATTAVGPALSVSATPNTTGFEQQPTLNVSIPSAAATAITGTVTLTFTSSVGGDDQLIQFSTGSRTVSFTIASGSTTATFPGSTSVKVMTGTVAGTITLTATASNAATGISTITTNPSVPFISSVVFTNISGGVQVVVSGFSSTRDMVSGLFHFAPSSNQTISGGGDVTVPLSSAFTTWYQSSASNAFGSEFKLTVPFSVSVNPVDVVAVTVTLTNSKGASNPVTPQ